MDAAVVTLFVALVGRFTIGAWKAQGRLSGHDRCALITSFAVAGATFVSAPLLINWVVVPSGVWLIAVGLLSVGVVGAVLRWPELAWVTSMRPLRRALGTSVTLLSCALMVALAVS